MVLRFNVLEAAILPAFDETENETGGTIGAFYWE